MKTVKKWIGFLFVTALIVLCPMQLSVKAFAEEFVLGIGEKDADVPKKKELEITNFWVDYANEQIQLNTEFSTILFTDKYNPKAPEKTVWESVDAKPGAVGDTIKATYISFSYLNTGKDATLYFKSPVDGAKQVIGIFIKARPSNIAAQFSGDIRNALVKGTQTPVDLNNAVIGNDGSGIYFTIGKGADTKQFRPLGDILCRSGDKIWNDFSLNYYLEQYELRGTILYFRENYEAGGSIFKVKETVPEGNLTVYDTNGHRPGKEVKLAVPKKAAAPKVSVNGSTYLLNMSKIMEYSVDRGKNWVSVADKHMNGTKVNKITLYGVYQTKSSNNACTFHPDEGAEIWIRTKATSTKAPSRIQKLVVKPVETPSKDDIFYAYDVVGESDQGITLENPSETIVYQYAILPVKELGNYGISADDKTSKVIMSEKAMLNTSVKWVTLNKAISSSQHRFVKISKKAYSSFSDNFIILFRKATIAANSKANPAVEFRVASEPVVLPMVKWSK